MSSKSFQNASKLNGIVSVLQFGADPTGATDSTTAFNAAVSAVGVNGTVVVPDGIFLLNSNVTAPNVCFIVYGLLYGSGIITGDNSTVVTYQGEPFLIPSAFGPGFKASQQMLTKSTTSHAETLCNLAVTRKTFGSGTNSPATADAAVFFNTEKDNWLTTTQEGEISGQFIVSRQGKNGDGSGILINAKKVKAIGGTGGSLGIEIANTWVDSSETRLIHIQTLMNMLEGTGGHSGNTGYGFYAEAQAGSPFAAYYAGGMSDGGPNSPGGFQNLLVYYSNRLSNAGVLLYKIDGNGRTYAPFGTAAAPAYSFVGDEDTGIYRLSANAFGFATNGTIRWLVDSAGAFWPGADNAYSVGTGSNRASVIYAATGAINTSDAREKQQIRPLSEKELAVAKKIKGLVRAFKFNDAVKEKGEKARIHVGVIAQDVADAFQSEGLDAFEYGILCYDEWNSADEVVDKDGSIITPAIQSGNRYGVRYEELLAFIISAL